ncbi:hypothetical protein AB0M47_11395 [Hamadaea sp. NPDC051192]|uniref:hypothetical protein n=1 Tax=Hamadaea sp. NPDC051192 TaxID=3154940 RepID=UPI0034401FA4
MALPSEVERYIRFQLEQLSSHNEHHTFETISFRIAERRISANLLPATGPVSAGGDQGRDAETYYTRLPDELPGAGGFVGRASTEPVVIACSVQKDGLDSKIQADLESICSRGEPVSRVAFFAVQDIPVARRHKLQAHARERFDVGLDIFDGQAVAHELGCGDLIWVAQRYLELPSHMVPDQAEAPQPEWYSQTLTALRSRDQKRLTAGAMSEVRDGLRHATFEAEARVDLPEWLGYIREFIDDGLPSDLVFRARYESVVATLRGMNTLDGVEGDMRAAITFALGTDSISALDDAAILLQYWGGAWARHIAEATADELRDLNLRLRAHVAALLDHTDPATHPMRKARLHDVLANLCLQPRWPEIVRPPVGSLPSPQETTALRRETEATGEDLPVISNDDVPLDFAEAMDHLDAFVDLLPRARAVPVGNTSQVFQMLAPVLTSDPRYAKVRDALDAASASISGDSVTADRCRKRAIAFLRAGRPLEALAELHTAKINWWHGDTMRGSLLAMRMIGRTYSELGFLYAAKQYALAAGAAAVISNAQELQDLVPECLIDALGYCYSTGNWADSLGFCRLAVHAHSSLAENAFDHQAHPSLQSIDFHAPFALLAAERFRPSLLPILQGALGEQVYGDLADIVDLVRPSFKFTEDELAAKASDDLHGLPFSDVGGRRTLAFAALGTTWFISCINDRPNVLAAERFAAAAQILLAELAIGDPVFLSQEIHIDLMVGTPFGTGDRVRFKPNNERIECTVILSAFTASIDTDALELELSATLVQLMAHLSGRPQPEFMSSVEQAIARGLMHKLHAARPYDDVAGLLDDSHYEALASVSVELVGGQRFAPREVDALAAPTTPGPGYDQAASLDAIRENYSYLPTLVPQTLPRILSDSGTVSACHQLRDEGWLDWHILIAIVNAVINFRARAAGLLDRPGPPTKEQRQLARAPETEQSTPIPLSEFTSDRLQDALNFALFAIGQRRWKLESPTATPNVAAFRSLLATRYGLDDDVPHRDLLVDALTDDGKLMPLAPDQ